MIKFLFWEKGQDIIYHHICLGDYVLINKTNTNDISNILNINDQKEGCKVNSLFVGNIRNSDFYFPNESLRLNNFWAIQLLEYDFDLFCEKIEFKNGDLLCYMRNSPKEVILKIDKNQECYIKTAKGYTDKLDTKKVFDLLKPKTELELMFVEELRKILKPGKKLWNYKINKVVDKTEDCPGVLASFKFYDKDNISADLYLERGHTVNLTLPFFSPLILIKLSDEYSKCFWFNNKESYDKSVIELKKWLRGNNETE